MSHSISVRQVRVAIAAAAILGTAAVLQLLNANPAASQTLTLTAYGAAEDPGLAPDASVWGHAYPVMVPLTAQTVVYPNGGGSIPTVTAKALHFGDRLYVRLEWQDSTVDQSTARVQDFSDAVAVEFPSHPGASVPSICMGQQDAGVNIWQWRADSQAGLKDPAATFANAQTDSTQPTDPLFYTARAAGNPYANPEGGPVQTLVSYAFGTLSPASVQDVQGRGMRIGNDRWAVVFSKPYVSTGVDQATFSDSQTTDMAVAVWNGSEGDRNGRKSVSQFVTLSISPSDMAGTGNGGSTSGSLIAASGIFVVVAGLGAAFAAYGYRQGRSS